MTYTQAAQEILEALVTRVRHGHSSEFHPAMDDTLRRLVQVVNADCGLIWLVVVDKLTVVSSFANKSETSFLLEMQLDVEKSAGVVLNFLA